MSGYGGTACARPRVCTRTVVVRMIFYFYCHPYVIYADVIADNRFSRTAHNAKEYFIIKTRSGVRAKRFVGTGATTRRATRRPQRARPIFYYYNVLYIVIVVIGIIVVIVVVRPDGVYIY